jgi:Polyketide cyclase / dehydrase and lipid transport
VEHAETKSYPDGVAWRFEHSAETAATADAIWRWYEDVDRWSQWSRHGVEWATIDGPFEAGATGKSKAPGSPVLSYRLVAVTPNASFVSEAKLPGARLRFEHVIEPGDSRSRITHRVSLDGPLEFVYRRSVRRSIERGLPDGVERLAILAASDPPSSEE